MNKEMTTEERNEEELKLAIFHQKLDDDVTMRYNHSTGKQLGISPIHLENKYSNKEIDSVLYKVNDLLYFFCTLYINTKALSYIINKLIEYGNDLNNINNFTVGDKKIDRKKELQSKMRELYKKLKSESLNIHNDEYFNNLVEKMGKYRLSRFLKDKESGKVDEWKYIQENKLFTDVYGKNDSVKSIQDELLSKYAI